MLVHLRRDLDNTKLCVRSSARRRGDPGQMIASGNRWNQGRAPRLKQVGYVLQSYQDREWDRKRDHDRERLELSVEQGLKLQRFEIGTERRTEIGDAGAYGLDPSFFSQRTPSLRVIGSATDVVCYWVSTGWNWHVRLKITARRRATSEVESIGGEASVVKSTVPLGCVSVIGDPYDRSSDIRLQLSRRHDGGPDIFALTRERRLVFLSRFHFFCIPCGAKGKEGKNPLWAVRAPGRTGCVRHARTKNPLKDP
ncbi:hypothetical protein EVAR_66763_1 [Eumeta japonica]|uniref:Uncharacterized protein n=1 Tax=Eumeta variegata TaxID=151549 RepID=A0A4C1Z7C0_EUMVA|nr:hypothetical protein EVAR_66763_1 [Eumeta japonica]